MTDATEKEYFENLTMNAIQAAATLLPHRVKKLKSLPNDLLELELRKLTNQLIRIRHN